MPTTSPGVFVRDGVEALRAAGHRRDRRLARDVPPLRDRLRRRHRQQPPPAPWLVVALPLFLLSYARAARRAAKGADVVHAHWLPSALPALATRRPFVLQLWGSDVVLAARARRLARALVRRAARRRLRLDGARGGRPRARRPRRPGHPLRRRRAAGGRRRRTSRRTPSTSGGSRRRRASGSSPRPRAGSRSSSSATGRCESLVPRAGRVRSARAARPATTGGPRSSSRRRAARATASPPARRWHTGVPSWRPTSAGSATRSRTASRGSSWSRGARTRSGRRCCASSATPSSGRGSGAPLGRTPRRTSVGAGRAPPRRRVRGRERAELARAPMHAATVLVRSHRLRSAPVHGPRQQMRLLVTGGAGFVGGEPLRRPRDAAIPAGRSSPSTTSIARLRAERAAPGRRGRPVRPR